MLSALLIVALTAAPLPADAPVLPSAERQADGRLLLSKEAEAAIDLRIKRCQAAEQDKANEKPVSSVNAAIAGLVIGLIVGGATAGLVTWSVTHKSP